MVTAVRVHDYGGPEVMRLEEVALPDPAPGEIRVRQTAIGVNYIDTYFRSGLYKAPALPFIAGNEAAGEVVGVGHEVAGFKPGDRVAYVASFGCYATERNVPASLAVHVPDTIADDVAASIMLKGMTAEYLLHRSFRVKASDTILMHAAAGGVGQILCQWAKHLGATVIGTAGTADKAELARANGCDHVILYREEDFPARVREITGGRLCDVVYDGVGQSTFAGSLDCLRPLGVLASFGSASGPVPPVDIAILGAKGSVFLTRPTLFTFLQRREWLDEMASRLFAVIGSGAVKIETLTRRPLAEAVAVHTALQGRETTGAIVLVP